VGTLPKPCNAGLIDTEWVIEDRTKSEVQQSGWNEVFRIKKVPLQGFSSVPTGSGLGPFCVKVEPVTERTTMVPSEIARVAERVDRGT